MSYLVKCVIPLLCKSYNTVLVTIIQFVCYHCSDRMSKVPLVDYSDSADKSQM